MADKKTCLRWSLVDVARKSARKFPSFGEKNVRTRNATPYLERKKKTFFLNIEKRCTGVLGKTWYVL